MYYESAYVNIFIVSSVGWMTVEDVIKTRGEAGG
jgi:hypothetical protein